MIIGVTGLYCSGKDTLADYLVKNKEFFHISLSDLIREEMVKRGKPLTRENMIAFANELRGVLGADILARLALQRMDEGKNYVVTSIRNPAEVSVLQQRKDFVFVEIRAPLK